MTIQVDKMAPVPYRDSNTTFGELKKSVKGDYGNLKLNMLSNRQDLTTTYHYTKAVVYAYLTDMDAEERCEGDKHIHKSRENVPARYLNIMKNQSNILIQDAMDKIRKSDLEEDEISAMEALVPVMFVDGLTKELSVDI